MLELTTHTLLFFKRKEFWFYNSENIQKGTYSVFCYSEEKDANKKKNVLAEQTSTINLEKSEEELYSQINKTFKYHIQKAQQADVKITIDFATTIQKCRQVQHEFFGFA